MIWLLLLLAPLSGLCFAEAISAHVALTASEIRWAVGGILLGLPIAPAIALCERRAGALRRSVPVRARSRAG